jgi:hypothetical protein
MIDEFFAAEVDFSLRMNKTEKKYFIRYPWGSRPCKDVSSAIGGSAHSPADVIAIGF